MNTNEGKLEIMNQSLTSLLEMKSLVEHLIRADGDVLSGYMARDSRNMGEEDSSSQAGREDNKPVGGDEESSDEAGFKESEKCKELACSSVKRVHGF